MFSMIYTMGLLVTRPTTGKGGDTGGKLAQRVLDGGEVFFAAAAILTVERLLLDVVLSIT